jgi:hypothetical protein
VYGAHATVARICREIHDQFYVHARELVRTTKAILKNCFVCQSFAPGHARQKLLQTDFAVTSRHTWGIDLITSLPACSSGYKVVLIAVDYFTGYLQAIPLKDSTSSTLVTALKEKIITPFNKPRALRSDQQVSMANSRKFQAFLEEYNITLLPTAAQAPWSNGLAESGVKAFKYMLRKMALQEGNLDEWDQLLPHMISAHNSSINIYNHSPEELMFGSRLPQAHDLLQFWPPAKTQQEYLDALEPVINEKRAEARRRSTAKNKDNQTRMNKKRYEKKFEVGSQVLHRQLQCATGTASSLHPKFNGVFTIEAINPDKVTAMIRNITTGRVIKAHFDNMQEVHLSPFHSRMSQQALEALNNITIDNVTDIPSDDDFESEIDPDSENEEDSDDSNSDDDQDDLSPEVHQPEEHDTPDTQIIVEDTPEVTDQPDEPLFDTEPEEMQTDDFAEDTPSSPDNNFDDPQPGPSTRPDRSPRVTFQEPPKKTRKRKPPPKTILRRRATTTPTLPTAKEALRDLTALNTSDNSQTEVSSMELRGKEKPCYACFHIGKSCKKHK